MNGMGSGGVKGGATSAPQNIADLVVEGERQLEKQTRDIVEKGGSKKELMMLSENVKRQQQGIEMYSKVSELYHKSAQELIRKLIA